MPSQGLFIEAQAVAYHWGGRELATDFAFRLIDGDGMVTAKSTERLRLRWTEFDELAEMAAGVGLALERRLDGYPGDEAANTLVVVFVRPLNA